jgi:DNA-binding transcriptional LysR family regulator
MRAKGHSDLRAFVAVAEQGSFSKAAEQLGLSPSSLSQIIRTLEERLGVRLLHRTTRSVALTEAGERLLLRVRPALFELDAALADVEHSRDRPAGMVRVRCLRHAFRIYVEPILAAFHETYPDIKLDILVDDAIVDLVASGFDVGFTLGEVLEKDVSAAGGREERFLFHVYSQCLTAKLGKSIDHGLWVREAPGKHARRNRVSCARPARRLQSGTVAARHYPDAR